MDFRPNYDGRELEPAVLPAAYPNLLVNGASGIAVGMATNMAPHNLGEVVAAARHLLGPPRRRPRRPHEVRAGPGPAHRRHHRRSRRRPRRLRDRPGLLPDARHARVEQITARRKGSSSPSCRGTSGPERVIEKIRDLFNAKKLTGIADVTDLTDGDQGLRLVIEIKTGFNPEAVLDQLLPADPAGGVVLHQQRDPRRRPTADPGTAGAAAGVPGPPARGRHPAQRLPPGARRERLHLVEGLLIAILDIDEVIAVIRASDDTATARAPADQRVRPH